jgi:hypothetical protein
MTAITTFTVFARRTVIVLTCGRLARPVPRIDFRQALHFQLGCLILEAVCAIIRYQTPFLSNKTTLPLSGSCMDDENLQRLEQNSEIRTT